MSERPRMIFHAPYPMEPNPTAASRLRPLRMRQAFEEIGYEVIDVSGTVTQRRAALRSLRRSLAGGERPDFLYSENSTQPNLLATSIRTGAAPLLDYSIMRLARRHRIPVGVFYRDAYWRVPALRGRGAYRRCSDALQRVDLVGYRRNGVHFFLPSEPMSALVGLGARDSFSALPPAGEPGRLLPLPPADEELRLIYVGGLGGHYDLDSFLTALSATPSVRLDLVTRPQQWERALAGDERLRSPAITAHHLSAGELEPLYASAQAAVLLVTPTDYWDIAVPVKLFEYLSYGRPVMATRGTEAGRIIEANGAGWVVDDDPRAIGDLLARLRDHPEEIAERAEAARRAASRNTWADRARAVAGVLTGKSR
ncbi:Glycosyltransferase involved in cell wall bisynthesis [Actinomyces denticolens]|uniref:Glycosyltransferase involved in cell wall bisynthesis n=1 Tax=Actinomyces denticolens TaxID=52767 RepID=A0ABY1HXZ2_9ACTO|nr:glycosyltransferase [Actinomyces denticolens]SHI28948.1 Glycosyltransferase involved in cell wall bisynthesis [Actinomyces denticolens]